MESFKLQEKYDPKELEPRWQAAWQQAGAFTAPPPVLPDGTPDPRPKYYILEMFPYPSGRIHMGHTRNYSIGDVLARAHRMKGCRVLYPMGWDSFGLPAENAAIKAKVHPRLWTDKNIAAMKGPLSRLGLSYDWSREISTCEPGFYVHEQRIFIEMFRRGLAYRKAALVNWCPICATVLANEQVEDGLCWRCQAVVVQRELVQWFIKITNYAQQLLDDIQQLEGKWPDKVLNMQRQWMSRSEGARIRFPLEGTDQHIEVFTTRPDTLFGATYMSIAAEHPLALALAAGTPHEAQVRRFVEHVRSEDKIRRGAEDYVKEGVFTGAHVINPATSRRMPVYIANFVLMDYGTGAVMAVPAHDQRDFEFARKYDLPLQVVIQPPAGSPLVPEEMTVAFTEAGVLVHSGGFDGLPSEEAKALVIGWLASQGLGGQTVHYRLRDWLVSRQRYWGCPIPMVECLEGGHGYQPVPDAELPVNLPEDVEFVPGGQSPLALHPTWKHAKCPVCGGPARRETDTMDGFMESSWYFLRYCSPQYAGGIVDAEGLTFLQVDQYVGGSEHATKHLIYARFFTKMLSDWGVLPSGMREPFVRLLTQGMVLKDAYRCPDHGYLYPDEVTMEGGIGRCQQCGKEAEHLRQMKMSKTFRNVVEPMALIERYGADTARLFCLFAAPPESVLEWSEAGVEGASRFLGRLYRLVQRGMGLVASDESGEAETRLRRKTHKTIKRVTHDIFERQQYNTAVAAVMELANETTDYLNQAGAAAGMTAALREALETAVLVLAPMAPHICEELWHGLGHDDLVVLHQWPGYDAEAARDELITIIIQVNGKKRGEVQVSPEAGEDQVKQQAYADPNVAQHLQGKDLKKAVYVKGRLLNLVVG